MDRKQGYISENDQLLDKLLKEDPGYFLSDDFTDSLVKKIEIHQSVKQNVIEYLTILGVVIAMLISCGGIYYYMNKESFLEIVSLLSNSYTPIITMFVLFIFFMDKVLLRLLYQLKL